MCTVVTRWSAGEPVQILAIRDELVSRDFDDPGAWWPTHPGVIGGRDRLAGGTWCASDPRTGETALVLNRTERHTGTPSRGLLPLAVLGAGESWPDQLDHRDMASFTLVLAGPAGVTVWTWDATGLTRTDLAAGTHVFTARGIDTGEDKAKRYAPRFAVEAWLDIVTEQPPADDRTALVVRHEFETDVFATVFGQLITAVPGHLEIQYSRTPWRAETWTRLG